MTAEQKRSELLKQLRSAGVESPAKMYPKRDMWTINTTPDDMIDRMQAHIAELEQLARYSGEELPRFVTL